MTETKELTAAGGTVLQTISYFYDVSGNLIRRDVRASQATARREERRSGGDAQEKGRSTTSKFAYEITDLRPGIKK
jgi:hypothetical protein